MKAVKNILFLDQDSCSLNQLFEAILRQAAHSDSVLSTAGLRVDSAEIEYPGTGVSEGKQPASEVRSSLDSLGFEGFLYTSKNIKLHPHLISWADLILVPGLVEEDLLCMFSHEAWSKTIEIDVYCGKPPGSNLLSSYSTGPKSKEEYLSIAATFKMLLPELINRIKDSYARPTFQDINTSLYAPVLYRFTLFSQPQGPSIVRAIDHILPESLTGDFPHPDDPLFTPFTEYLEFAAFRVDVLNLHTY